MGVTGRLIPCLKDSFCQRADWKNHKRDCEVVPRGRFFRECRDLCTWMAVHLNYLVGSLRRNGMEYDGTVSVLCVRIIRRQGTSRRNIAHTEYDLVDVRIVPIVGSVLPVRLRDGARMGGSRNGMWSSCTDGVGIFQVWTST